MLDTLTRIESALASLKRGDSAARDRLIEVAYERLRVLASQMLGDYARIRARGDETGDILHEAMLRLMRALDDVQPDTPRDFLGLAAMQLRRELIDLSRRYFGRKDRRQRPRVVATFGDSTDEPCGES